MGPWGLLLMAFIQDVASWILDQGSGLAFILDPGSRIWDPESGRLQMGSGNSQVKGNHQKIKAAATCKKGLVAQTYQPPLPPIKNRYHV